jgi:hypothetical protein
MRLKGWVGHSLGSKPWPLVETKGPPAESGGGVGKESALSSTKEQVICRFTHRWQDGSSSPH